jgi:hypothetical protein
VSEGVVDDEPECHNLVEQGAKQIARRNRYRSQSELFDMQPSGYIGK